MATWAKVGDGLVVLSGEVVYPVVSPETFYSKKPCVSRTGSETACMDTTSEVTSAVSVVHRLSEDISDSSSNSSGDGDVIPPSRGRCCDNGRDGWVQVVEKFYHSCPL